MMRFWLVLTVLLASPAFAQAPRLTLFITVDSMGSDALLRHRERFKGGFGKLLSQGALFPSVQYEYAETVTAPGHTTLVTGANPWRHGVVSNALWDRARNEAVPVFADPDYPTLETPPGVRDSSPRKILAENLSDRLRLATGMKGKSVSISGKGRSAIAMAGRLGQAWWFSDSVGKFVTGTWYTKAFPEWVKAWNAKKIPDSFFGKSWTLSLPQKAYTGADDLAWESDWYGLGRAFPHPLTGGLSAPGTEFYKALASSPEMNELLVGMAKAAIEGEQLGRDGDPDLLSVSFSNVDRIYHLYGPYSWEFQDALMRLDRSIGELVTAAGKAAGGRQNLLVVISADHGGAAIPEGWASTGLPAVRRDAVALTRELEKYLQQRFGVDLVLAIEEVDVYLDEKAIAAKGLSGVEVRRAAAEWLARDAGVALAIARDDLDGPGEHAGYLRALRLGYYPGRSGDVLFIVRPYHVLTEDKDGTSHGTPYSYDNQVFLLLAGRGVRPGEYPQEIPATDVAPTVAALLGMIAPAMSEGTPRAEAIRLR
ncbi:MAG: alkaline phosphatase family protein [Myxococcaceae bacterium]